MGISYFLETYKDKNKKSLNTGFHSKKTNVNPFDLYKNMSKYSETKFNSFYSQTINVSFEDILKSFIFDNEYEKGLNLKIKHDYGNEIVDLRFEIPDYFKYIKISVFDLFQLLHDLEYIENVRYLSKLDTTLNNMFYNNYYTELEIASLLFIVINKKLELIFRLLKGKIDYRPLASIISKFQKINFKELLSLIEDFEFKVGFNKHMEYLLNAYIQKGVSK